MASLNSPDSPDKVDHPPSFFKVGEIRRPTEEDYQHFLLLTENHDNWIRKCNKNNVTVWMKDIPGVTIKMLKVHAEFDHVKPSVMYQMLEDAQYRSVWDDALIADDMICRLEGCNSDICYYAMKCPAPLRNRDFIGQRCWKITEEEEYIVFNHSVAHERYPPSRQFIRGLSYVTGYVIRKSGNGSSFSYLTHSDPRGNVPKWLLNIVASKIAPRIALKMGKAAEDYMDWKKNNLSEVIHNHSSDIPVVPVETLQHLTEEDVPLSPVKGEPDDLGDEEVLEDSEVVPNGLSVDPMLMNSMNGIAECESVCDN